MTPGRPKEFDRQAALASAVEVFWEQGYHATSIEDLLARMNIGRQSLYDTFGDKETLFCQAVEHYQQNILAKMTAILRGTDSPLGNIRSLFGMMVERMGDGSGRGCMLVNASIEFAGSDADTPIMRGLRNTFTTLERVFRDVLKRAITDRELPEDFNVTQWSTFLAANMQSMLVLAKTGAPRAALQRVAQGALSAIGA